MRKIVNLVYVLTFFILVDLIATLYWVVNELGTEANPIMNFFLSCSPLLFVVAKLGLSAGGVYILYFFRNRFKDTIFKSLVALNLIYISVFVYHLWGLLFLISTTI
ncbi:hypothetical protein CMI37_35970 [Candidatus Pacearchaeota archaeon]|nr:hypothetical protein [Candidatus Pacearchaeota archaeon]